MQFERSGPAVHGVSRHKQRLQLLVGVVGVLVDLHQAVVDAAADVGGQGGEQVIVFCRGLPDVADSELALDFSEPRRWVVGPEVGDSECHVAHVLVLVSSLFL
jgi:hypothetical protein